MEQEENSLKSFFQKIFTGTASHDDKERAARWMLRLDVSERKPSFDEVEEQRLRLRKNFQERFLASSPAKKTVRLTPWLSAAAAVVLIVAVTALFLVSPRSAGDQVAYRESFTKAGERKNITLSDGTRITLNNASLLKFPEAFNGSTREVYLDGEAFFEVSHDKEKPFIVRTDALSIRVLGTSFNVSGYAADDETDVTVQTGKVSVHTDEKSAGWQLTPGQQLSYHHHTHEARTSEVDLQAYTGWQSGELVFENELLTVICRRLERWYDVNIVISTSSLMNRKISMEQKDESLENVMRMLGIAGGFHYEINGKNVRIW